MDRLQFAQDLRDLSTIVERLSQHLDDLSPDELAALAAAAPSLDRLYQKNHPRKNGQSGADPAPDPSHSITYRHWIESITDGFFAVDRDWRITYLNRHSTQFGLREPEYYIGKILWDAFPSLRGKSTEAALRRAMLTREPSRFEIRGNTRGQWYIITTYPTPTGITIFCLDNTLRRQTEAEFERLMLENIQHKTLLDAIFSSDPSGLAVVSGPELRIVYANPAYRFICPETAIDILDQPYSRIWPPETCDAYQSQIAEVLKTGQPFQKVGFERHYPDGTTRIFSFQARRLDWKGQIAALIILWDITDRKHMEETLRASEARFRLMGETIPYGFWLTDPQGAAIYASQSFLDLLQMTLEEMRAFGWTHRLPAEDVASVKTGWTHSVQTGEDWDREYRIFGPDQQYHTVLSRGRPVRDENGKITNWVGISLDITDFKELQEQVKKEEQRIEAQRLILEQREQERLQIARDLHDGPVQDLTGINFALQNLILDTASPETARQLQNLRAMVQELIDGLRAYAGELRPPNLAKFGLAKAIFAHLETFQEKYPGIQIRMLQPNAEIPLPEETRLALFRIYQEAITNIAKHAQATQATVCLAYTGHQVTLEIQDNGIGFKIPKDWLELARHKHLGLVGIQERVEAIGAKAEISSRPGAGTRIKITLLDSGI